MEGYNAASDLSSIDVRSSEYTNRLRSLLESKLDLVNQLHELSMAQQSLSSTEEVDAMMGMIARRDGLMDHLLQVQQQLLPYRTDDPNGRLWQSIEAREHCQRLLVRIEQLVQSVIKIDEQTLQRMCDYRDSLALELRQGADLSMLQNAYAPSNETLQATVLDINDL